MKIELPKPPSVNALYGYTCQGRFPRKYITHKGKAWFEEAGFIVKKAWGRKKPIETPLEVWVELHTSRHQDVDNVLKATFDLLQKMNVIANDSLVYKVDVEKFKCKTKEEKLVIELMGY